MGAVNTGVSSVISSTTVNQKTGKVVLGGNNDSFIGVEGTVNVSGDSNNSSGSVEISGKNIYQEETFTLTAKWEEKLMYFQRICWC